MDYGVTAEELGAYFSICGEGQWVTILWDKFSGHPKGSVKGLGEGVWVPQSTAQHEWPGVGPCQHSFHPSNAYIVCY